MDSENGVISLSEEPITKRTLALGALAVVAAMPLVWFTVDVHAGEKLLKLTQSAPTTQTTTR